MINLVNQRVVLQEIFDAATELRDYMLAQDTRLPHVKKGLENARFIRHSVAKITGQNE